MAPGWLRITVTKTALGLATGLALNLRRLVGSCGLYSSTRFQLGRRSHQLARLPEVVTRMMGPAVIYIAFLGERFYNSSIWQGLH